MIEWGLAALATTVFVVLLLGRRRRHRENEPRFGGSLKDNIETMRRDAPFRQDDDFPDKRREKE